MISTEAIVGIVVAVGGFLTSSAAAVWKLATISGGVKRTEHLTREHGVKLETLNDTVRDVAQEVHDHAIECDKDRVEFDTQLKDHEQRIRKTESK